MLLQYLKMLAEYFSEISDHLVAAVIAVIVGILIFRFQESIKEKSRKKDRVRSVYLDLVQLQRLRVRFFVQYETHQCNQFYFISNLAYDALTKNSEKAQFEQDRQTELMSKLWDIDAQLVQRFHEVSIYLKIRPEQFEELQQKFNMMLKTQPTFYEEFKMECTKRSNVFLDEDQVKKWQQDTTIRMSKTSNDFNFLLATCIKKFTD